MRVERQLRVHVCTIHQKSYTALIIILEKRIASFDDFSCAVQRRNVVGLSAYFTSKQIPPFAFEEQNCCGM